MTQQLPQKNEKQKLQERREKVSHLLVKGCKQLDMADQLGVSRETIARDVRFLKEQAMTWFKTVSTADYIFEYKILLDKLKDFEFDMRQMIKNSSDNSEKIKIIKPLQDNIELQLKMLTYPVVNNLLKITKGLEQKELTRAT